MVSFLLLLLLLLLLLPLPSPFHAHSDPRRLESGSSCVVIHSPRRFSSRGPSHRVSSPSTRRRRRLDVAPCTTENKSHAYYPHDRRHRPSHRPEDKEEGGGVGYGRKEIQDVLGPIGLLALNAIELVVVTAGPYVSGGMLGYVPGGMMGAPSALFGKSAMGGMAIVSCGSWATLNASFSGFNGLVRLCQGEGAFLNRSGGPEAMTRGGAMYAGFTYVLNRFFKSPSPSSLSTASQRLSEFMCMDLPLDDDYDDRAF
ncbi:hypothetical protein ACHAW5_008017 [Stephanodiscus triporus]|uniref:Uncharacterized protein n=1 Tax=Stephanodiscus triporus TaxID=2934178 RepID=A0ABD3P7P9_9STRA